MTRHCSRILFVILLLSGTLLAAETTGAQAYKVERISLAAPQELAAEVRETLAGEAIRVVGPNGPLCAIWLRKAVPTKAEATKELGIGYGQLTEGTLVGAVHFPASVIDYRQQRVKPGVYTLRYALLPVDGDHLGVSPLRDFLLPAPAALDTNPANITRDALLNLGRKVSGGSHPSVWSLQAAEGHSGALPSITHQKDGDLWVVRSRLQFQTEKSSPASEAASGGAKGQSFVGSAVLALVVVGHAPEA